MSLKSTWYYFFIPESPKITEIQKSLENHKIIISGNKAFKSYLF